MPTGKRIVEEGPKALPVPQLLRIEAQCCRADKRKSWFTKVDSPVGAVGRMLHTVLDLRNSDARTTKSVSTISEKQLLRHLRTTGIASIAPSTISNFLAGRPTAKDPWLKIARSLLYFVLLGEDSHFREQQKQIADRILKFFLPKNAGIDDAHETDRSRLWYFSARLREIDYPATTAEAIGEMRALSFCASKYVTPPAEPLIIRTSGGPHFLQINLEKGGLTLSGSVTLECLRAGVEVVFVYPKGAATMAERTYFEFRTEAETRLAEDRNALRRLYGVALDPAHIAKDDDGKSWWSGEFFAHAHRHVFHWCRAPDAHGNASEYHSSAQLMISRSPEHGPCAYRCESDEVKAFQTWYTLFVKPEIEKQRLVGLMNL